MASKLGLYNNALTRHLGERKLSGLAENQETRKALDDVYDEVVRECLSEGMWRFARRVVQLNADDALVAAFGPLYSFVLPSDVVRLFEVSLSAYGGDNFELWHNEGSLIRCDAATIYVVYVSNDPALGMNLPGWPAMFTRYVETALANAIAFRTSQSEGMQEKIEMRMKRQRARALSEDAMDGPNRRMPVGTWIQSRFTGMTMARSGNNGNQ